MRIWHLREIIKPFTVNKLRHYFSRQQIKSLSARVFKTSNGKVRKATKPPVVNQKCLVYKFEGDLCNAVYVDFTRQYLCQGIEEHKNPSSSVGKHFREKHCGVPWDLSWNFTVLKKYKKKFDCLVTEMFFLLLMN